MKNNTTQIGGNNQSNNQQDYKSNNIEVNSNTYRDINKEIHTYQDIPNDFLEKLFGDHYKEIYKNAYSDDVIDFINDYGFELSEYLDNYL